MYERQQLMIKHCQTVKKSNSMAFLCRDLLTIHIDNEHCSVNKPSCHTFNETINCKSEIFSVVQAVLYFTILSSDSSVIEVRMSDIFTFSVCLYVYMIEGVSGILLLLESNHCSSALQYST